MADIKTKKKQEVSIKKLDRAKIVGQNLKSNIISVKDKTKENYEKNENTAQEYAENKVMGSTTVRVAAVAIMASTAFPPFFRISRPA